MIESMGHGTVLAAPWKYKRDKPSEDGLSLFRKKGYNPDYFCIIIFPVRIFPVIVLIFMR